MPTFQKSENIIRLKGGASERVRCGAVRCGEAAAQAILGSTDGVVKTGAELAAALSTPAATASASCSRMDELVSNSGGQEVQVAVVLGGAVL